MVYELLEVEKRQITSIKRETSKIKKFLKWQKTRENNINSFMKGLNILWEVAEYLEKLYVVSIAGINYGVSPMHF